MGSFESRRREDAKRVVHLFGFCSRLPVDPGLRRGDGWVWSVIPAKAGIHFKKTTETDRARQRTAARKSRFIAWFSAFYFLDPRFRGDAKVKGRGYVCGDKERNFL